MSTAMVFLIVAAVIALPGLVNRRGGPLLARLCALVALGAIAVAALDLPREILTRIAPRVAVVPTAPLDAAATGTLRAAIGDRIDLRIESGREELVNRLARARLRHRDEPALVLLWSGPFASEGKPPRQTHAALLGPRSVAPLDPDAIQVRSIAAAAAGRPGAFEVDLGPAAAKTTAIVAGLHGRLVVRDPASKVVGDTPLTGDRLQRVAWQPTVAGTHTVRLELMIDGIAFRGAGRIDVVEPPHVTVVGSKARLLAPALSVQGLAVSTASTLPKKLEHTLVLLDPLSDAEQTLVRRFVEDGGGAFLVGGAHGGAVPGVREPLGALSPVLRSPLPPPDERGKAGKAGEAGEAGDENPDPPTKTDDPPSKPPKKPPKKPPDKNGGDKLTGDAQGAKLTNKEVPVERRSIAMVLLIDRSGSMSSHVKNGNNRMDLAKVSARETARALDPGDLLGVISFGDVRRSRIVLPMVPVTESRKIDKALSSLRATAPETRVADGLNKSRTMLSQVDAAVKFVVVITDGAIDDVRETYTRSAASRFKKAGITLVVVQILAPDLHTAFDAAKQASTLARLGNGYLLQQDDFARVPRVNFHGGSCQASRRI